MASTFTMGDDLEVARIGYGTMQIVGDGYWGEPRDRNEAIKVLRSAVDLGVTFIDAADAYGPFVAEDLIREALHPYPQPGLHPVVPDLDRRTGPPRRNSGSRSREHNATPAQLALAWLLQRAPNVLPIPGTSSLAHLQENVAAAQITLSRSEFAALSALGS